MFTASEAIAQLDAALLKAGSSYTLQVTTAGVTASTTSVRARVRGYRPNEIAGEIRQGDMKAILSPTGLGASPKQDDRLVVEGVPRTIVAVESIRMAGTIVRHELQLRG